MHIVRYSVTLFFLIDGKLNSGRYISTVLRPVNIPFIWALRNSTLQLDNVRLYIAFIVLTFLDTENVWLHWSARSKDPSLIENVWSVTKLFYNKLAHFNMRDLVRWQQRSATAKCPPWNQKKLKTLLVANFR